MPSAVPSMKLLSLQCSQEKVMAISIMEWESSLEKNAVRELGITICMFRWWAAKPAQEKLISFPDFWALQSPNEATQTCKGDLGEVSVVSLGNPMNWLFSAGSDWFVDYVDIIDLQSKRTVQFPCYHWIADGDAISFTSKTSKCYMHILCVSVVNAKQTTKFHIIIYIYISHYRTSKGCDG